jgi:transposase-like protein
MYMTGTRFIQTSGKYLQHFTTDFQDSVPNPNFPGQYSLTFLTITTDAATTMVKKSYTIKYKIDVIAVATERIATGESIRSVADFFELQPSQLRRWLKNENVYNDVNSTAAKSTCGGRPSSLEAIEEQLLIWIFELREQGLAISYRMVQIKSASLLASFRRKSDWSQYQCVRRWLKSHRFVIRCSTHESQRPPHEVMGEARDFVVSMKPRFSSPWRHKDWIINMDQTHVFFP